MKRDVFIKEATTLANFIEVYCSNKHENITPKLNYKDENIDIELCSECMDIFNYSLDKLKNCPYEEKPMCRKCKNPCYEKSYWKRVAKIMRYSGIKLGFLKVKNIFGI